MHFINHQEDPFHSRPSIPVLLRLASLLQYEAVDISSFFGAPLLLLVISPDFFLLASSQAPFIPHPMPCMLTSFVGEREMKSGRDDENKTHTHERETRPIHVDVER